MRFSIASALLLAVAGCQQTDPTLEYKITQLEAKLESIDRKVSGLSAGNLAGARPPSAPQPPRPQPPQADPSVVYSVPIGDAATRGPANAKVTIIEAADFA